MPATDPESEQSEHESGQAGEDQHELPEGEQAAQIAARAEERWSPPDSPPGVPERHDRDRQHDQPTQEERDWPLAETASMMRTTSSVCQ